MDIIYEIPGLFRITHIREIASGPWAGATVKRRRNPFLVQYRAPEAECAEHVELPDDLFLFLLTQAPEAVQVAARYLREEFAMSPALLAALNEAPKSLLDYTELPGHIGLFYGNRSMAFERSVLALARVTGQHPRLCKQAMRDHLHYSKALDALQAVPA